MGGVQGGERSGYRVNDVCIHACGQVKEVEAVVQGEGFLVQAVQAPGRIRLEVRDLDLCVLMHRRDAVTVAGKQVR